MNPRKWQSLWRMEKINKKEQGKFKERRKRMLKKLYVLAMPILFCSCLAAGVPYSNNPRTLMAYAMEMHYQGRPFRMKEFIEKAYKKYEAEGNQEGIAEVYRLYGKYYRYHPEGIAIDKDNQIVSDKKQLQKSLDYSLKALHLYKALKNVAAASLSAVETGQAYSSLENNDKARAYLDEAQSLYNEFLKTNKPSDFPYQINHDSFQELINYERSLIA